MIQERNKENDPPPDKEQLHVLTTDLEKRKIYEATCWLENGLMRVKTCKSSNTEGLYLSSCPLNRGVYRIFAGEGGNILRWPSYRVKCEILYGYPPLRE